MGNGRQCRGLLPIAAENVKWWLLKETKIGQAYDPATPL
jgi:hypothetical protein